MRRAISVACVLLVVPLVLLLLHIRASLPGDTGPLIREKYGGWSGVLRLWVYEGWAANAMGWLNRAISAFEKEHEGVYIQARKVDAEALRAFTSSGVEPPDMILFPPGLLDGPEALAAVGELPALRPGLAGCADGYAAPVLMGGYAWVYDRQTLDGPPGEEDTAVCAPSTAYASPPAAYMLLSTGKREAEVELEAPGLDLGLPASAEAGKASPVNEDAYGAFTRGESPALVATQAEVRRLTALAETGRGPDWTAAATGEAMLADQLLLLGIVDWPREDIAGRQALCRAFLLHLLDAETQATLETCGALPVIEGLSVYGGENGYAALEAAASLPLLIPPVFGEEGREALAAVSEAFFRGELGAAEGLARLRAAFSR